MRLVCGAQYARGMSRRDREKAVQETGPEAWGAYLRERIYATFTGLAIVLVVGSADHAEADHAFLALVLGVVGIVVAGFVSDIVSHLLAHGKLPSTAEYTTFLRISAGGLSTVLTPGILMLLAWLDVIDLETAVTAASIVYIVTLVVIARLAVRKSDLSRSMRLVVLAMLVGLGIVVIALQTLAKSV